ncbi:DUF4160 domain-containing protein [Victivallis sp. Marseille-Q1083]|uniref:DUF4160 domain-containing protein n=1 Tax=Victivallis sp. Marseille-Q1083 TaxID=2717288 RepID=UPI0015882DA6|nr:DUF4160 domain-containing protein [Victivallis sp. Marseille-Q1083]
MPIIFYFKGFAIKFWLNEESRCHVHAVSPEAKIKIWLEPKIEVAQIAGNINPSLLNELLKEVKKHERECRKKWNERFPG